MTDTQDQGNVTPIGKNAANEILDKIAAVAATATALDRKTVEEIVARAKAGEFEAAAYELSAAACAVLFTEHNPHNRDWNYLTCLDYAREMSAGQWKRNCVTLGFYRNGVMGDGQHRTSGAAIAGTRLEVLIAFGLEQDAIVTVDAGKPRQAADALKLDGISDSKAKQTVIKMVSQYLVKTGDKAAALKSNTDIANAVKAHNELLDEALAIGSGSLQNIVDPVLKAAQAQAVAYLELSNGWPADRVSEKLAKLQTGFSVDGDKSPLFVAAEIIKSSRKKAEQRDRLGSLREIGVAIYAMTASQRGARALTSGNVRSAVKKSLPDPSFPGEPESEATSEAA